jgi:O-methyltransferase
MNEEADARSVNEPVDTAPYGQSVIPKNRLEFLVSKCAETLRRVPGNVIEVGVYKGGSLVRLAGVLRDTCPEYKIYGIDTFTGHPYTDGHPIHPTGKYADVLPAEVERLVAREGLDAWVSLVRGRVEEVLGGLGIGNVSFAHVDCDLYLPVKFCARAIPPMMNAGGVIYFDDYGHDHCPGATRAVEEVFDKELLHDVYMPEDNTCWSCYVQL